MTYEVEVLDLSGAQPAQINAGQVKSAGIAGMWPKATEGVNFVDGHFYGYAKQCQAAGMPFGAYHYFRVRAGKGVGGQDGRQQAEQFCDAYFKAGCTLPPMVDVEANENTVDSKGEKLPVQPTADEWRAGLRQFCDVVMDRIGRLVIYTSKGEWESFGLSIATEFASFDLWIAAVGASAPSVPLPWKTFRLWQYTWTRQVAGIAGSVDASYFNGSQSDFETWSGTGGGTASKIAGLGVAGLIGFGLWKLWQILGR